MDNSPARFPVFSGDVNLDWTIDVTDIINIYNDQINFLSGYVTTDVNGDNFVDVSDVVIAYNNSINVVNCKRCNL